MKRYLIIVLIIAIVFLSGCIQTKSTELTKSQTFNSNNVSVKDKAIDTCIKECKSVLNSGMNLSNGPCLSDNDINWMIEDWVCDMAHYPRENIDNLPENQCQAYIAEEASHFVELDPSCNFIRAI